MTSLRDTVDLTATINNYNQAQLPEIVAIILSSDTPAADFGLNLLTRFNLYLRQLFAIIIHCCVDSRQGFDAVLRSWVVNFF